MPPLLYVGRVESGNESESAARKDVGSGSHESCMRSILSTQTSKQIGACQTHPILPVKRVTECQQQFLPPELSQAPRLTAMLSQAVQKERNGAHLGGARL